MVRLELVQVVLYSFVLAFVLWWFLGHFGIMLLLALGVGVYYWLRKSSK